MVVKATIGPTLAPLLHLVLDKIAPSASQDQSLCPTSDKHNKSTPLLIHTDTPFHLNILHQKLQLSFLVQF